MRMLAAAAWIALMLQLLILPSRYSEAELTAQFMNDLKSTQAVFGIAAASLIRKRAESLHHILNDGIALFEQHPDLAASGQSSAPGTLSVLRNRLGSNPYSRAMAALAGLWCLRLSVLAYCWSGLACLTGAALIDGWTSRRLRHILLRPSHPERFALAAMALLGAIWANVAVAGTPGPMSLETLMTIMAVTVLLLGGMVAWHHGGNT